MIQYDLRTPLIQNVLVSAVGGLGAALCASIVGFNIAYTTIVGFVFFTVILVILKIIEENSYTTVTYLDEDDVERIRAQLNATEKEGEA